MQLYLCKKFSLSKRVALLNIHTSEKESLIQRHVEASVTRKAQHTDSRIQNGYDFLLFSSSISCDRTIPDRI